MTTKRSTTRKARRAAVYLRISKDRDNEISTEVQRKACRDYCRSRGWKVVDEYQDIGRSAFKRNVRRPGFEAMVETVEAGDVDTVVAYRLDRVARSVRDFANLAALLDENGAEFVSVAEQFDGTTPMGRAMVSVASVFAELESAVKSERIGDAMAHQRASGAPTHGPRPFGLTADRKATVPAEARLIRAGAKRVLAGDSLRAIAADLNAKGSRTARGSEWSRRSIAHVLCSPTTAGLRDVDGVLVGGTMPTVLDRATWDQVRSMLEDPARRNGTTNATLHLLTGVVTCSTCGTPMASKPHRFGRRYACAPRKGHDACQSVSINAEKVDELVTDAVLYRVDSPAVRKAARNGGNRCDELARIEADLEALAADFGRGLLTRGEWQAARVGLDERRAELETERVTGRVKAAVRSLANAKDVRAAWDALDVESRRTVVRALTKTVTIGPAVPGRQFDVERIGIDWAA
jgi:DNA invertase Pin-like site-specific DNA recombinase